jgi:hypothetical protein
VLSVLKSQVVVPSTRPHILLFHVTVYRKYVNTLYITRRYIAYTNFEKQKIKARMAKMISKSRSGNVQTDSIEEIGNQREYVICTYCKGELSDCVQEEVWVECVTGEDCAMRYVQRRTTTNPYMITVCRTKEI